MAEARRGTVLLSPACMSVKEEPGPGRGPVQWCQCSNVPMCLCVACLGVWPAVFGPRVANERSGHILPLVEIDILCRQTLVTTDPSHFLGTTRLGEK